MSCKDFERDLRDLYLETLSSRQATALKRHQGECTACDRLAREVASLTCRELTDFLNDYVDDRLEPERRGAFELHLAICPTCETYLKSYRRTMEMSALAMKEALEGLPDALPPDLVRAILDARRKPSD